MASPYRATNDENAMASTPAYGATNTSNRRALANVSTNPRVHSPLIGAAGKKVMAGSPLKRSFTAAMEGGQGFTYLKRRRLSDDETLGQLDGSGDSRGTSAGMNEGYGERSRSEPQHVVMPPPSTTIVPPSPTVPNTPSDSGEDSQGSSNERGSFSSLINYDPSSQPAAASQQPATDNLVFKTVSHAQMLRLKLCVAMYKVRTDQINVPFAQLRVERPEDRASKEEDVEGAVASLRQDAREGMPLAQPQPAVKLLPAPVLLPTAYSSRMIYADHPPSSPPISSPPKTSQENRGSTPLPAVDRLARAGSAESTSSVVRGRVAEGLLGLRNAT